MELQFRDTSLRCLRQSAADTRNVEQTLELRLPENMPPIGRVLGAWGQPLLRGKEWRTDHVTVSGGVMAQVLYEAQDGTGVHCVEGWLPFQIQWELCESQGDGSVTVSCLLRSVDARQVGAEKLMLRATVSAMARALESQSHSYWEVPDLPEDIQLLSENRRLCVPLEAGEKPTAMEEELVLPPGKPDVEKILYYQLSPSIKEKKVMSDKLVFRGTAQLHAVYLGVDGMLHAFDTQLPLSLFVELEREYGPDAQPVIEPAVTDLELERLEDGRMRLKAGILGQYVVYDFVEIPVTLDAYSTLRPVQIQSQKIRLPAISEQRRESVTTQLNMDAPAERIVDCSVYMEQPRLRAEDGSAQIEGMSQVLYYDGEGRLQGTVSSFQQSLNPQGAAQLSATPSLTVQAVPAPEGLSIQTELDVDLWQVEEEGMEVICGLTLGEIEAPDPKRPSLILRKAGDRDLWELAKAAGSTVEAICKANALEGKPDPDKMLLIPVL